MDAKRPKNWTRSPKRNWWARGVRPIELEALNKAEEKRQRIAARNLAIKEKENERSR